MGEFKAASKIVTGKETGKKAELPTVTVDEKKEILEGESVKESDFNSKEEFEAALAAGGIVEDPAPDEVFGVRPAKTADLQAIIQESQHGPFPDPEDDVEELNEQANESARKEAEAKAKAEDEVDTVAVAKTHPMNQEHEMQRQRREAAEKELSDGEKKSTTSDSKAQKESK